MNFDSAKRRAMVLRICEFLISSLNFSPAGTKGFTEVVGCWLSVARCDTSTALGVTFDGEKFSTSLLVMRPFSPVPFT